MVKKFSATAVVALFVSFAVLPLACKKAAEAVLGVPNPTTLQLQFTSGGKTLVFNYKKTNTGFTADSIILPRSISYTGKTVVLDTTQNPASDLTQVYAFPHKRDYIVIYTFTPSTLPVTLAANPSDVDDLGYSFGQFFNFTSYRDGVGSLNVLVKYGSDKRIADPALSGGTVFINATFPLKLL